MATMDMSEHPAVKDLPWIKWAKAHSNWEIKTRFREGNPLVEELFPDGFPEPRLEDFQ